LNQEIAQEGVGSFAEEEGAKRRKEEVLVEDC
jgi:hypothetical protein